MGISVLLRFPSDTPTAKSTEPISMRFELLGPLGTTDLTFVVKNTSFNVSALELQKE